MRTKSVLALAIALTLTASHAAIQAARVGEAAPAFSATDTKGKTHSLSDFKGRWVVLEWHNSGCPYVRKHYDGRNMQRLQKEWTGKGVVWLTVISSAEGQQGHVTAAEADAHVARMGAAPTAVLLDPQGTVGHAYEAKTTPHMFVINPQGLLIYNGAIDDKPTTDQADLATAANHVSAALTEAMAGRAVTTPTTRPYGCGVKYAR